MKIMKDIAPHITTKTRVEKGLVYMTTTDIMTSTKGGTENITHAVGSEPIKLNK